MFEYPHRESLEAAKAYLRDRHLWLTRAEGAVPTGLTLRNAGKQSATGVRLRLSFPEGIVPFGDGGFGAVARPRLSFAFEALFANHPALRPGKAAITAPDGAAWLKWWAGVAGKASAEGKLDELRALYEANTASWDRLALCSAEAHGVVAEAAEAVRAAPRRAALGD